MPKVSLMLASLISVMLLVPSFSGQAAQTNVEVDLLSVPPGAEIKLKGNIIGRTNLKYELPPGTYTFTYSFPGFSDTTATYDISDVPGHANGGVVTLPDGPSFASLSPTFANVDRSWVGFTNQLQAARTSGLTFYNAETRTTYAAPLYSAADNALRQQLHLTDEYASTSPSGRYYVSSLNTYAHPDEIYVNPLVFHIYDKQTGNTMAGAFTATGAQVAPTELTWSRNEEWASVYGDYGLAYYLHIQNNQITIIDGRLCTLDTGETWFISYVYSDVPFSGPNSKGEALLHVHSADPNNTTGYACIVDLNTSKGMLIPIANPIGAVFSPDGQSVYVINSDGLAVYNRASKQVVWLDKNLGYMTQPEVPNIPTGRLFEVNFANTAQYAIIGELIDGNINEWIYKVPTVPSATPSSTPTVTPVATSASVPGGNQIGG